jgi:hypothetical protein
MEIWLINRTDRPERREHAMAQLKSQSLNAHLYPAKIDKIGWKGCRDSHLSCLVSILHSEEMGIILEDDCLFLQSIDLAFEAMVELPVDWDALYLGGSPRSPQEQYSEHLYKVKDTLCAQAIIWNPREGGAIEYILDHEGEINKYDVFLREEVQPRFNCFMVKPLVVTQKQFQSDTCHRSDVSTIQKFYNIYCK